MCNIRSNITVIVNVLIIRNGHSPIRIDDTYRTYIKSVFIRVFNVLYTHHILNDVKAYISLSYPNESCRRIEKRESNVKQVQSQCACHQNVFL